MRKQAWKLIFAAVLMLPATSFALGLGDIEVSSALNQPLDAEVDIVTGRPDEVENLIVSLADLQTFNRAGLERSISLTKLRFKVAERSDGSHFIKITTRQSVREPFLTFLLEADWAKGKIIREFTLLLDPPVLLARRQLQEQLQQEVESTQPKAAAEPEPPAITMAPSVPVPEATPIAEPVASSVVELAPEASDNEVADAESTKAESTQTEPAEAESEGAVSEAATEAVADVAEEAADEGSTEYGPAASGPSEYAVVKNDSLWGITRQTKDASVSMAQMMMAYLQANPDAFVNDNINHLKAGYVLRIPTEAEASAVRKRDALLAVKEQNALWQEYVAKVSGQVVPQAIGEAVEKAAPESTPIEKTAATSTPAGAAEEATDVSKLLLLAPRAESTNSAAATDGTAQTAGSEKQLEKDLALSEESLEAAKLDNQDLTHRLDDLEGQADIMNRLLALKSDELTQIQNNQTQNGQKAEPTELVAEPAVAEDAATNDGPEEAASEEAASEEAASEEAAANKAVDENAAATPEEQTMEAETAVVEEPAPVAPVEKRVAPSFFKTEVSEPNLLEQYLPFLDGVIPKGMDGALNNSIIVIAILVAPILLIVLVVVLIVRAKKGTSGKTSSEALSFTETQDLNMEASSDDTTVNEIADITGSEIIETPEPIAAFEEGKALEEGVTEEKDGALVKDKAALLPDQIHETAAPVVEAVEEEQDETISEVDVYLAYGLYQQAEDLLKEVIEQKPDRMDYRIKLLEAFYSSQNKEGFETQAQAMHDAGGADSQHWEKALAMGAELAPDHALFAGADTSGLEAPTVEYAKPEAADFDLDADDTITGAGSADIDITAAFEDAPELGAEPSESDDAMNATDVLDLGELDEALPDELELPSADEAQAVDETELELPDLVENAVAEEDGEADKTEFMLAPDTADSFGMELSEEAPAADKATKAETEIDEGLEFDLGDLDDVADEPSVAEEVVTVSEADTADALDLGDLELDALDLGDLEFDVADTAETDSEDAVAEMGLDLSLEDDSAVAADEPPAAAVSMESTVALDEPADISLDEMGSAEVDQTIALDADDMEDLMLPDDVDEVSTKLDLAKAFIDMGDSEGARSTLEEVVTEGSAVQKKEAEDLIAQI
ncbi:MAG: hypothetical protein JKY93_11190 [Gammaproteobacteria bacterium]|nr:hypothetical protein [Gammaproteobacteria bacterium]